MSLPAVDSLASALKETFGFSSFRPLQREIMEDSLAGHDILALLPTGGGKSLCYQLPAFFRSGLTIVISPLIALMKDQVDSLLENGIKAAYLNSSRGMSADKALELGRAAGLREGPMSDATERVLGEIKAP